METNTVQFSHLCEKLFEVVVDERLVVREARQRGIGAGLFRSPTTDSMTVGGRGHALVHSGNRVVDGIRVG